MLGESLYISGKYLDYEDRYVKATSKVESLSAENKSLKGQNSTIADEAKKDKDLLKTLERSINTEQYFSKLKDKQIAEALLKVKKASLNAVEKFKAPNEYLDKLCDYYVEGFDLLRKYLEKHISELDLSNLDMEAVEKEVLADRQSTKEVREGGEATVVDETINVDSSSSALP